MTTQVRIVMHCPDGGGLDFSAGVDNSFQSKITELVVELAHSQQREKQ